MPYLLDAAKRPRVGAKQAVDAGRSPASALESARSRWPLDAGGCHAVHPRITRLRLHPRVQSGAPRMRSWGALVGCVWFPCGSRPIMAIARTRISPARYGPGRMSNHGWSRSLRDKPSRSPQRTKSAGIDTAPWAPQADRAGSKSAHRSVRSCRRACD